MNLNTSRLLLVPMTAELVGFEMSGNEALGQALAAEVPDNWPPEQMAEALPWFKEQLKSNDALIGWLGWYGLCHRETGQLPVLVGSGGFFGLPKDDGIVEIGYSVLPQYQGRGYGTEIVKGLVDWALSKPSVRRIIAETSSDNLASLRVLHKAGFSLVEAGRKAGSLYFERRGAV